MSWGYDADNGPDTWYKDFPIANGKRQSPVDIRPKEAQFDVSLSNKRFVITYKPEEHIKAENNGKSVLVKATKESVISGGPLEGEYRLEQFHFHWGSDDTKGSEHTLDGKEFASEMHLVHYNKKYGTFSNAVDKPDGLAVFGFFIQPGKEHQGMSELMDQLKNIRDEGKSCCLSKVFDMKSLLSNDTDRYWTYDGSLTTPPLYESVTWIVFEKPIEMSEEQLKELRSLTHEFNCKKVNTVNNFRPPMDLGGRTLRASFKG